MKYAFLAALLIMLSACDSGALNQSTLTPNRIPLNSIEAVNHEAQDNAMRGPLSTPVPVSNDLLYVANTGNNSITVYPHDVSGNTAPKYVISGSKTGLSTPGQLSEDAQGNLYVANGAALLVFAHGATGNVAPIRTLAGPITGINLITAMTVDQITGKIFVGNRTSSATPDSTIIRFPPNASGNMAPYATIDAGYSVFALASDSTGKNLITSATVFPEAHDRLLYTITKQFANSAPPSTIYEIVGNDTQALTDDPATKTYLAMVDGIVRFAENTSGNFEFSSGTTIVPAEFTPAIVSTITSETCGSQMVLGYLRNIYVSHSQANCPSDAIYVYTHDASGNATPLRILSGSATKLDRPYGIYEGK